MKFTIQNDDLLRYEKSDELGSWTYYKDQPHSFDDQPSFVSKDGAIMNWHTRGLLHRTNGPAVVDGHNAIFRWYWHGLLHRENGPSLMTPQLQKWYCQGMLHREDGPAAISSDQRIIGRRIAWAWHDRIYNFNEWVKQSQCDPELALLLTLEYGGQNGF